MIGRLGASLLAAHGTASAAELGADQDEMEGLFGQQFFFVGLVLVLEFFVYETTNQVYDNDTPGRLATILQTTATTTTS